MNKGNKDEIIRLHSEGKDYRQIKQILSCSLSTISYHLSNKTKQDTRRRRKIYQRRNTELLKNELGGKCKACGYSKCFEALDFHHLDPSTKIAGVPELIGCWSLTKAREEANKCILLCANCHREFHAGQLSLD